MMIRCPECDRDISMDAQACPFCGAPSEKWLFRQCPQCGKKVHTSVQYCENCHYNFKYMDKYRKNKKKKDSALSILSALFGLIGMFLSFFSIVAGILGIIDLASGKNDGKRHAGAWVGIIFATIGLLYGGIKIVQLLGIYG